MLPGADLLSPRRDLRRLRKVYPRLDSIAGHRITGYVDLEEQGTEFRYFTFLREPVALCASRFQYQIDYRKKNVEFDGWVARNRFKTRRPSRSGELRASMTPPRDRREGDLRRPDGAVRRIAPAA